MSVERNLSFIHCIGDESNRSVHVIESDSGSIIPLPFPDVSDVIEQCFDRFGAWGNGYDSCQTVIRDALFVGGITTTTHSLPTVKTHIILPQIVIINSSACTRFFQQI